MPVASRFVNPKIIQCIRNNDANEVARILSADPNAIISVGKTGRMPIHEAAWIGNNEMITLLLKHGADINQIAPAINSDTDGYTPLHYAVVNHNTNTVKFLLDNNADAAIQSISGSTPKDLSIKYNMINITSLFLDQHK